MNPQRNTSGGMVAELRNLLASVLEHLSLLAKLVTVEARHALGLYLQSAIALAIALVSLFFGYVLLLLFVAFAAASLFQIGWIWITLGLAILHLLGALGAVMFALTKMKTPVFAHTSDEIRKDIQTLQSSSRQ